MSMNLGEYRAQIDVVDDLLIRLLEKRMDIAAGIAQWKIENDVPVLDSTREGVKLDSVHARCRVETADLITGLFADIMAASREYQTGIVGKNNDK